MALFEWHAAVTSTFAYSLSAGTCCMFLPPMCYYLYRYYQCRNDIMIKKRFASITLIQVIFSIVVVASLSLFQIAIVCIFGDSPAFTPILFAIIALTSAVIVANLIIFRVWLILFENSFAMAKDQYTEWKHLINPNFNQSQTNMITNKDPETALNQNQTSTAKTGCSKQDEQNRINFAVTSINIMQNIQNAEKKTQRWFLKHKNDFGSYYFVRKIVIIKLIIECGFISLAWGNIFLDHRDESIIFAYSAVLVILGIELCVMLVLGHLNNKFNFTDYFWVNYEIKIYVKLSLVFALFFGLAVIVLLLELIFNMNDDFSANEYWPVSIFYIIEYIAFVAQAYFFSLAISATYWVLTKLDIFLALNKKTRSTKRVQTNCKQNASSSSIDNVSKNSKKDKHNNNIQSSDKRSRSNGNVVNSLSDIKIQVLHDTDNKNDIIHTQTQTQTNAKRFAINEMQLQASKVSDNASKQNPTLQLQPMPSLMDRNSFSSSKSFSKLSVSMTMHEMDSIVITPNDESSVVKSRKQLVRRLSKLARSSLTYTKDKNRHSSKTICLKDVLKQEACLEVFVQHLAREYSIELIIAFIELTQFRMFVFDSFKHILEDQFQSLEANNGNNTSNGDSSFFLDDILCQDSIFPDSIPDSIIISNVCNGVDNDLKSNPNFDANMSNGTITTVITDKIENNTHLTLRSDNDVEEMGQFQDENGFSLENIALPKLMAQYHSNEVSSNASNSNLKAKNENVIEKIYECRIILYRLYCKYIKIGSPFELNISSFMRKALMFEIRKDIENISIEKLSLYSETEIINECIKLYDLFEPCRKELVTLLQFSFLRLKLKSKEFAKILTLLNMK